MTSRIVITPRTENIAAELKRASEIGSEVFFTPGRYVLEKPIRLKSGMILRSSDPMQTRIVNKKDAVFLGWGVKNVIIEGLYFIGGSREHDRAALNFLNASNVSISNCLFKNAKAAAILFIRTERGYVVNSKFKANDMGVVALDDSEILIEDSEFSEHNDTGAVEISDKSRAIINSSDFLKNKTSIAIMKESEVAISNSSFWENSESSIFITKSRVIIEDSKFKNNRSAVSLTDNGYVEIQRASFRNHSEKPAVEINNKSIAVLEDNEFINNETAIFVLNQGKAELIKNKIYDSFDVALGVTANSTCIVDSNEFMNNQSGIVVSKKSVVDIKNCRFSGHTEKAAIIVGDDSGVFLVECILQDNVTGILVVKSSHFNVASNKFVKNKKSIMIIDDSKGFVRDNVISEMEDGIIISKGSKVEIKGNEIERFQIGVLVDKHSEAIITRNKFFCNDEIPISITDNSRADISNNVFYCKAQIIPIKIDEKSKINKNFSRINKLVYPSKENDK